MTVDLEAVDPFDVGGTAHGAVVGDLYIEATYDSDDRVQVVKIAALTETLDARQLERIPWARTLRAWQFVRRGKAMGESFVGAHKGMGGGTNARNAAHEFRLAAREYAGNSHPGRAGYPDAFYEHVARRYAALVNAGVRHPNVVIAKEFEEAGEQFPDSWAGADTVKTWVHKARQRKLLPPASPGRAG